MESDEVWPPPIDEGTTGQPPLPRGCSRAATVFGVMSLVLTLPGFLYWGIAIGNIYFVHNKALFTRTTRAGEIVIVLFYLPFVGLGLGMCGWRSLWGKWGVACAAIYCGVFFYLYFRVHV